MAHISKTLKIEGTHTYAYAQVQEKNLNLRLVIHNNVKILRWYYDYGIFTC
jgi:hypothetical protein